MRQGLLFSICVSIIFCAPALAYDWSTNPGDGSEANPYQISTPEQLIGIGADPNLLDKNFILTNDISFDPNNNPEHVFDRAPIAPDFQNEWGGEFQGTPFTGCFDGNGYSILNLKIVNDSYTGSDYLGLFGFIEGSTNTVSVKNLSFIDPVINIGYEAGYVGALCGKLKDGIVKNCIIDSLVVFSDNIDAHGGNIGGLVGKNENGLVEGSSIRCDFHKIHFSATGGLAGRNTGTIENSTVNCNIINENEYSSGGGVGGITGINIGNITGCVSKGYIEGPSGLGGVVGGNSGECLRSFFIGTISCNEFRTWDVSCGGFVGANYGDIKECYTISRIHLRYTVRAVGGFVGYADGGTIDRCGSWTKIVCNPLCEPRAIGGFHGRSPGDAGISNCYSQGEIHTNNENMYQIGGFAGACHYDITACYTTVKQIHNQIVASRDYSIYSFSNTYDPFESLKSFYDLQRSNIYYDAVSGTPLNTKQMQVKSSFMAAGWDFKGEDDNGTEDIWIIDSGDYPRLAWLPKVSVPEVLNIPLEDAQENLDSVGLTVGDVRYHYSDSVPAGTVTIQSLRSGLKVTYGREINLWVSNGQPSPYSGGGDGTEPNPCRIGTAGDLMLLGQTHDDYDKCFVLINDIDMAPVLLGRDPFFEAVIAPVTPQDNWHTYWYMGGSFRGALDGNNHCISNLQIKAPDEASFIGLIGRLYSGRVDNLSTENIYYSPSEPKGRFHDSGGLTGLCIGSTVSGCSITGKISTYNEGYSLGGANLGGLTGLSAHSELTNCHVAVDIEGSGVGGLVGRNDGSISRCSANGDISAGGFRIGTGGLVGDNYGTISECIATGVVVSKFICGGLVGNNYANIFRSCFSGSASSQGYVGGICGENESVIKYCYSSGSLSSNVSVAGICNVNRNFYRNQVGIVEQCYSACSLSNSSTGPDELKFGLVGSLWGVMTDSYWDITVSNTSTGYYLDPRFPSIVTNVQGYATEQMKQQASYVNWDFENIWWIDEGNDYPILRWQMPNIAPVSDAGADQTVYAFTDGYALVQLDGMGSSDADGDVLEYYWFNDANELIATGAEPNVLLPVGEHEITLFVNDGIADSEPDVCVVTVVDPFDALADDISELVQHKGIANSLLAKLDAARKKLEDGNENNDGAAVGSLGALINAVNAQRGKKISEEDADYLISVAEQIINML